MRIAMISGPRTVSTALLRAWGGRDDTVVWDEPLYAHFLHKTGVQHPGREAVLEAHAHELDAAAVASRLAGPVPDGKAIWYQKHIAHHLRDDVPMDWIDAVQCAFLIRNPARSLASLWKRYPGAGLADTGLPQQVAIFERVMAATGQVPPVIDSDDVRSDPEGVLRGLCAALDVPFDDAMLSWSAGPRDSDGAWGPWWYDVVWASTGFAPPPATPCPTCEDARQQVVLDACMPLYATLAEHRITPTRATGRSD